MKVVLFGATGMVGQGVLRECLLDHEIDRVTTVGRTPTGQLHEKLRDVLHTDLFDLSPIAKELEGLDACFFCLGVSSAGMSEKDYRRITYDLTLSIARTLVEKSPGMTFIYVSGTGTDSTERGSSMWARVKGETENALLALPFRRAYMFRPGYIQPMNGITSKTKLYRAFYAVLSPLYPVIHAVAPKWVTTTVEVSRAMIAAAKHGAPNPIVENRDLAALAGAAAT